MCGRTRCTLRVEDVRRATHRTDDPHRTVGLERFRPSYNVAPGWNMPVVRMDYEPGREDDCYAVHVMRWGLIPSFTKKTEKPDFFKMFNARAESIGEKASFRRLLPKNRCLVTVDGFYEWKKEGPKKQPYYVHFKDGRPLVFAALYDSWKSSDEELLHTFTIVTTSSSPALRWLHDRMPVILAGKEDSDNWLCGSSNYTSVLKPYENPDLVWFPVTPQIGKISFDGPECVQEIKLKEEKGSISKFFVQKPKKEESECKEEESMEKKFSKVKDEEDGAECEETVIIQNQKLEDSSAQNEDNFSFKRKRDPETKPDEKSQPKTPKTANTTNIARNQPTLLSYFGKT